MFAGLHAGFGDRHFLNGDVLQIALVPHPLGGQKPESIEHKAAAAITQIVEILTTSETALMQQFLGKM